MISQLSKIQHFTAYTQKNNACSWVEQAHQNKTKNQLLSFE